MRIFHNIDIRNNEATIQRAVAAILERAQEQRLRPRQWSLVELHMDDEDFVWLRCWAHNLHESMVQSWLEESSWRTVHIWNRECSQAAALGTLLLLFATETARRQATEGILWATFQQDCFHVSTLRRLFVSGQPTRPYKDALEAAARWLQIRHVFGVEGLQNWFDTVYLQFGFTYRGFLRRLPEWLVGQGRTQALQHLLEGPMRSETFCSLWDALRNFRRNNIKAEQLKTILVKNCWVLPEWIDELATQAVARIELGKGNETGEDVTNDLFEPFLEDPILCWDGTSAPKFVCQITNLARYDLSEQIYSILVAGQVCTQLRRNGDGVYIFHPSEEIVLPIVGPLLIATLVSSTGQLIASATLTLWNMNDEITVFRATTGKRIDAWLDVMRPENAYFLVTASDLQLFPDVMPWTKLDVQGTKLSLLNQGWSNITQVQLDGQILWQPNIVGTTTVEEPKWARAVDVSLSIQEKEVTFGDYIQMRVSHPKGTTLSFIRLGMHAINFSEEDPQRSITEPIMICPDLLILGSNITGLCFTLGVRNDTKFARISRIVSVPVVGAVTVSQQGWIVLQPDTMLTVEQAKILPIQLFRPNLKVYALLEGDVWIGRPYHIPRPLGSLMGLGNSIKLRLGPYNATVKDILLIREVVDRGIIDYVQLNTDTFPTILTIHLLRPIELDQKHHIVIWNEDGKLYTFSQEDTQFQVQTLSWSFSLPSQINCPLAIAVAYDGIRLGAWWHADWSNVLRKQQVLDMKYIATLLRWFQLPLLSNDVTNQVQQFVNRCGSTILPIWLSDISPIEDKQYPVVDDRWLSAVRHLFKQ